MDGLMVIELEWWWVWWKERLMDGLMVIELEW